MRTPGLAKKLAAASLIFAAIWLVLAVISLIFQENILTYQRAYDDEWEFIFPNFIIVYALCAVAYVICDILVISGRYKEAMLPVIIAAAAYAAQSPLITYVSTQQTMFISTIGSYALISLSLLQSLYRTIGYLVGCCAVLAISGAVSAATAAYISPKEEKSELPKFEE